MASHQRRWFRKFTVRFRPIKNATMSSIYNSLVSWQATSLLDSSVVRALHRYRRGHGFESRSGLSFALQFKKCLSLVYLRWWIMSSYLSPQFKYNIVWKLLPGFRSGFRVVFRAWNSLHLWDFRINQPPIIWKIDLRHFFASERSLWVV